MFFPQLTYATNYCVGAVGSGKCPAGYSGVTNDTRWTAQANVPTDIQDFIIDENMKLTLGGANPGSTLDLNVTGTLYVLGKLTTNGSYTDNVTGYGVVLRADSIYVSTLGIIEGNGTGFRGSRSSSNRGDGPGGGYSQYASGGQGAAHGGSGGRTDSNFYQPKPYGSIVYPTTLGSGGGAYDSSTNLGGNGGNALMLFASSIVEVNGTINASGIPTPPGATAGGGGSGGSILINASTIRGTGLLEARGGNKGTYTTPSGGAGGRIALRYSSSYQFTGRFNVTSGTVYTSAPPPHNGSIALIDLANNDLYIVGGGTGGAFTPNDGQKDGVPTFDGIYNFRNIYIGNSTYGATVWMWGNYTNDTNDIGIVLNATGNITVYANSFIMLAGTGFNGSKVAATKGDGPGGGGGVNGANCGGMGGSHGGDGGKTDCSYRIAPAYDSLVYPVRLGSGGGSYGGTHEGGMGGGAVQFHAGDTVEMNGTVNASGISNPSWATAGGGGSGGAILINASTIKGNGKLEAKGGNKGSYTTPGGGSEGVGKGCNYNQTGQPKLTVRQQRIMDVVNTRRYMAGTSAGEMDIVPRQYQRQLLAIPAQKTPSLPIPFTTPSLGEFHADLQPQVKILNELIGRLQSSTATTSLTSTQGQSQLRKLIQLETQLQERITSRLQGRFQTQAKTQTQMQTQMQIQLQRMRTPQPRIITMLFLPENKNGRLGSPGRRFSLKTGAHIEGERSALADLLSVNKSLSEYGRATHPSFRKRPELWPGASSITGHVPTVEQLHTEPKHEAPSRLSKLLNQTGRRLL